MARKALQIEVLQAGLRKRIINVIKLSAEYRFDEAIQLAEEYIEIAENEVLAAKEAVVLCQKLYVSSEDNDTFYKRAQAAKELGITIDTIRNWEMNGLLVAKRIANGYRVYDANDMNRLKIIRSLRCANYSLSAILRMLNKLEKKQYNKSEKDMLEILNNPDEDEDILLACDRLIVSLEKAIENAQEVIVLLEEIKQLKQLKKLKK